MLSQIFIGVLIPLITIVCGFLVKFINTKSNEVKTKTHNQLVQFTIDQLNRVVVDCIQTTNQTYVDSLKAQGKFDKEAQKVAFKQTYDNVVSILSADAKEILGEVVGDLKVYITNQIEANIK